MSEKEKEEEENEIREKNQINTYRLWQIVGFDETNEEIQNWADDDEQMRTTKQRTQKKKQRRRDREDET